MIKKVTSNDYLKRVDNMLRAEKEEYRKRVGEWLHADAPLLLPRMNDDGARLQNVVLCSAAWNDEECNAWTRGAVLLTALVATGDTWLPDMLYEKAAKRSVRRLVLMLTDVYGTIGSGLAKPAAKPAEPAVDEKKAAPKAKEEPAAGTAKATQAVVTVPLPSGGNPAPVRPKHIDQYVHLLPAKTQEKAAMVRGLLRDLDVARENARRLADAGGQSDKIAQWATAATKLDNKIKFIYKELDAEWDKLVKTGVVTVDAFGNAIVAGNAEAAGKDAEAPAKAKPGRPPLTEEEKEAKKAEKEEKKRQENQRKAALLRKWLIDKRNARTDEQKDKWLGKYKEMVRLGGDDAVTDKVREAAEFYGISLEVVKK